MKQIALQDSGVIYDVENHTYHYNGKQLQGITSTLINRAYPKAETYANVPEAVLVRAAERGRACHQAVGNFYTIGMSSTGFEAIVNEAKRLLDSACLTPIRFEYVVTDFEHYASPIDIVCLNAKDEICIVDMKYTSKLLYEQVTLQTSIYKRFFHLVNPKLDAKHQFVLWTHTNDNHEVLDSGIYELQLVEDDFIDDLIQSDINNAQFNIKKNYGAVSAAVSKVEDYIAELSLLVKEKSDELDQIKAGLCKLMLDNHVKQYDSLRLKLTTVTPKPRQTFNTKAFKADYPDLYNKYITTSTISPSIHMTVKA